jgi:YbgC/YbaW family acyl-CoA thioester hydrolase
MTCTTLKNQSISALEEGASDRPLERFPGSQTRIRFQDCDPFGHLHNARYLDYFINAREEHLREFYGFDIFGPRFMERNWVVRSSSVNHLAPAVANELVSIHTSLRHYTRNAIQVEATMEKADGSKILAVSRVEFRHIDLKTGRLVRHEADLMNFFGRLTRAEPVDFGGE